MRHVAHRGRTGEEDEAHSREISKRFARPLSEWHCPAPSQPPVATDPTPSCAVSRTRRHRPGAGTLATPAGQLSPVPDQEPEAPGPVAALHAPVGRAVTPTPWTRRILISMAEQTWRRPRQTASTCMKSRASSVWARARGKTAPGLPGEVAARLLLDVIFWTSSMAARRSMRPSWPPRSSCVRRRDRSAEAESLPHASAHGSTLNSAAVRCSPAPRIPPAGVRQPGTLLPR